MSSKLGREAISVNCYIWKEHLPWVDGNSGSRSSSPNRVTIATDARREPPQIQIMDIQSEAREFLSRKRIAVAGISTRRDTPANLIFKTLRARGVEVIPISSSAKEFEGSACYPDVKSIPDTPEGLVIVTRPAVAEALVRECVEAGVPRVWMHCALGTRPRFLKGVAASTTSVSDTAVKLCRDHGITVIAGSCPMQFIGDPGHRCMRALLSVVGALEATP